MTTTTELTGERTFTWFTPAGRKPTEYELFTVGLQSNPEQWLHSDWPVRFDDGTPPWSDENSAVRTSNWRSYRDPSGTYQRPYVQITNQDQQALARLVPTLLTGTAARLDGRWSKEMLGRTYAAWPFVEYGLFLALAYGVRQAMSDTVQYSVVFQSVDRLRLLQDIVTHLDALGDALPGFDDSQARDAWMNDPALVPTRELVEHIVASTDWVEAFVVITLVIEPLLGYLAKNELFTRAAAMVGDVATPTVLAAALNDSARHVRAVQALVRLLRDDEQHGPANRAVIDEWFESWGARSRVAAQAFLGTFTAAGVSAGEAEEALQRALENQRAALEGARA